MKTAAIRRWGSTAWMLLGIMALATLVFLAVAAMAGLVVPLLIAVVVGTLGVPVVDWLERHRLPRSLGAFVFLIGLIAVLVGSGVLMVSGVIDQGDEISRQVTAGVTTADGWLEDIDADFGSADNGVSQVGEFLENLIPGLASSVSTIFSGAISFLVGTFIGLFLLYYVLKDWNRLHVWLARHLGVPDELGEGILDDATFTLRQSFYALSLSSLATGVIIGIAMAVLGVPLAFTVALVTFATSYIPYLGAVISGAFAFLVALGAAGPREAIILLIVILIVQNVVQTLVQTKLTSDRLSLHPIANLASTIVGAALAGLIGATLSAPILAMAIAISRRVKESEQPDGELPADGQPTADVNTEILPT